MLERELPLAPEPTAAALARSWTKATLRSWGVPDETVWDASLLVSELVGNVVLHGRSPMLLRLVARRDVIRVEVYDEDARLPAPAVPNTDAISGRGLQIVAGVARAWGAEPVADGKVVWAELATASA